MINHILFSIEKIKNKYTTSSLKSDNILHESILQIFGPHRRWPPEGYCITKHYTGVLSHWRNSTIRYET